MCTRDATPHPQRTRAVVSVPCLRLRVYMQPFAISQENASVAQRIRRPTTDREIVSSNLTGGTRFFAYLGGGIRPHWTAPLVCSTRRPLRRAVDAPSTLLSCLKDVPRVVSGIGCLGVRAPSV